MAPRQGLIGPHGLIRSLISQFLRCWPTVSLDGWDQTGLGNNIESVPVAKLCELFELVTCQIPPKLYHPVLHRRHYSAREGRVGRGLLGGDAHAGRYGAKPRPEAAHQGPHDDPEPEQMARRRPGRSTRLPSLGLGQWPAREPFEIARHAPALLKTRLYHRVLGVLLGRASQLLVCGKRTLPYDRHELKEPKGDQTSQLPVFLQA